VATIRSPSSSCAPLGSGSSDQACVDSTGP